MLLPPWFALFGAPSSRNSLLRFCAAVHRPVGERAVVERAEVDRLGVVVDAGDEGRERHRAARLQRQLGDARLVDDRAAVGVAGFEQRRFRRDVDALGKAADAELRVDDGDLAHFEPHVGARVLLEAAHLHRQRVQPGTEERHACRCLRCSSWRWPPRWFPGCGR